MTGVNVPLSALPGPRMPKAERELRRRLTDAVAHRAYLIHKQPWRVIRNRRLRAEIDALMEASGSGP